MRAILTREVIFEAIRSRGPGGQNVNKVSSAALLLWDVQSSFCFSAHQKTVIEDKLQNSINKSGYFFIRSDEFRDLERNKQRCLEKFFQMLEVALHRPKPRRATRPTLASKARRREAKRIRSQTKGLRRKVQ
jgi:ribosome-associated protein